MSLINPFSVSFACVALAFAAGGDYVAQSKAHGSYPGAFPVSAYVDTFGERFDYGKERLDKRKRQSVDAREHLPEPGQGWSRAAWDVASIDINAVMAGRDILGKSRAKEEFRSARLIADADVWEYQRGTETVRIFARFDNPPFEAKSLVSGWLTERFSPVSKPQYKPFAIVQGVPFMKIESGKGRTPNPDLMLEAHMGENIRIAVAASASRDSVLSLLDQIDFDSLNLMLDTSFPAVGSDAPRLTPEQEVALGRMHADALNAKAPVSLAEVNAQTIRQTVNLAEPEQSEAAAQSVEEPAVAAKPEVEQITVTGTKPKSNGKSSRLKLSGGGLVQITN